MPLPPALLARLKKRGLVKAEKKEVFAENYDEESEPAQETAIHLENPIAIDNTHTISPLPIIENGILIYECAQCPNLQNPYHNCVAYCFERYGRRKFFSDLRNMRLKNRMLQRYPLPSHWLEVGDPSTGRFYYWNTKTDDVCWLSPLHPRAKISQPGDIVRANMLRERDAARAAAGAATAAVLAAERKRGARHSEDEDEPDDRDEDKDHHDEDDEDDDDQRPREHADSASDEENASRRSGHRSHMRGSVSPENEASKTGHPSRWDRGRSEADPIRFKGTWSAGLEVKSTMPAAKTGVDETASGSLYQQRPYPSPGDILRANAAAQARSNLSENDVG
ncbi:unnamed protein product [Echinostoma caproni]|uniref:Polyglutamine-binding protein 1 n=1 Tax=Echinostoma caproni TaxID=27848 RepID=A0A183AUF0_9TREM|nr:unnamed protein product [Echinostoma caproni]